MNHKPIQFKDLSLNFSHKSCFQNFSGEIHFGDRIALIGRNGSGKSMLLKMLCGLSLAPAGEIKVPCDVRFGHLPQVIEDYPDLSGGQRLNQVLSKILSDKPNVLLLDEPTNHLDSRNRRSLMRMLKYYPGTLIIASHDTEFINTVTDILWHIDLGQVIVFRGAYFDYQQMLEDKKASIKQELSRIAQQKKKSHLALMREQERNKRSRVQGEKKIAQRKWPTIRSHTKLGSAITTGNKRLSDICHKKQQLIEELSSLNLTEVIQPKFKLKGLEHHKPLIRIQDASIAYESGVILKDIYFHLSGCERVALHGNNASGKSTFVKAILGDSQIKRTGEWAVPNCNTIGYLDQHYQHLNLNETVLDLMSSKMLHATYAEIRAHLNDFLFRKNEEVEIKVKSLSGGEKARLSLALIAAEPPKLLILDEITNNVDLETRTHIIEVLSIFPGAMLVISHDHNFLESIHIETRYQIHQGKLYGFSDAYLEVIHHD
ncbi:TPA: ATP-binding cassette domain-containing protein [Legionella pneumophila]|uniref:ABC-F family ATP-binding cassette domain-containing protein n=1 Tax=Legionella pneumophila TaxID=446 RepID=A0AAN5KNT2_LEGPN|nr:ABC-F family ATP-binding cassette domain-containing protein [Legionella pneumophila]HAT1597896.1 ABC-F family ATP-binding cassette domain-containing protein [Legionella pneumophila]HAT1971724.1 ABC-F family ATP-binding cassette domain-containing protein [Legionella pneumophila]HAT1973605.1 ABC-F family ATP-binding cassette domain-containing protein [Legionella pneumophila]HAT6955686.1 ATP-binding cassette domain-containing protein [Legionella pneumophila]